MNYKKLVCLFLWAYAGYASAQSTKTDTVETARKLSYNKNYTEAAALLQKFETNHPKDINSVRLHGQVLYWMYDFDGALALLDAALKRNPNPYVQLDYARMLFQLYHLQPAKELLEDYLKTDGQNIEAINMLGTIAYWQGHTALAKAYFAGVMEKYPENDWAVRYVKEIDEAKTPYLSMGSTYSNDSQPLNSIAANVETGWYSSYLLAPKFDITVQDFTVNGGDKQLYEFNTANKFYFADLNLKATIGAGTYKSPADNKAGWIGDVLLDKKLSNLFSVDVYAAHKPYFFTASSLQQGVTLFSDGADLVFTKENSWSGWAGYSRQQFMDNNTIQALGASILSPPLKFDDLSFNFGYAFNFTNAATDYYEPSVTAAQYLLTGNYNGVYTPYFTPDNQVENSLLANMTYKPINDLKFTVNSRIGVYTTADKPYFYLNYNASNQLIIQKGYYSQQYTPVQINASVSYNFSKKTGIQLGYTYVSTFFYTSNMANLGLNFKF